VKHLTAGVTRWWGGRDSAALTEPASSHENAQKRGDSHQSGARRVRRNALTEASSSLEKHWGARLEPREQTKPAQSPADIMTRLQAKQHCQPKHKSNL
jgi:hypothetical protein